MTRHNTRHNNNNSRKNNINIRGPRAISMRIRFVVQYYYTYVLCMKLFFLFYDSSSVPLSSRFKSYSDGYTCLIIDNNIYVRTTVARLDTHAFYYCNNMRYRRYIPSRYHLGTIHCVQYLGCGHRVHVCSGRASTLHAANTMTAPRWRIRPCENAQQSYKI